MAVIASGEIDLKLSAKSQAALENQLSKVSNQAGASSGKQFSAAFGNQTKGLGGTLSKALGNISPAQIVAGVATAGAAISAFAAASVSHFEDAAQAVRGFQRITGQTGPEASRLVSVFDDMNISAGAATNAMGKLAVNIGDGGEKLGAFGIAVGRSNNGSQDLVKTFDNVRAAILNTTDPAERVQIAVAAFGKTGKELLPVLQLSNAEFEKMKKNANNVFTDRQLQDAEDYRRALDNLGDSIGDVENVIGAALVPILSKAANALSVVADKGKGAIVPLATGLVSAIPGVNLLAGAIGLIGDKSDDTALSTKDLATASDILGVSQADLANAGRDLVTVLIDQKKGLDDVYAATLSGFDAGIRYQQSLLGERDSLREVWEKQNDLNDAIREFGAKSPEAAKATDDLTKAQLNQQDAAVRSEEAMGALAEANAKAGGASDGHIEKINAQIASLQRSITQIKGAGGNVDALVDLKKHLEDIRGDYVANVDAATGPAMAKIAALRNELLNLVQGIFGGSGSSTGGTGRSLDIGANLRTRNDTVSTFPPGISFFNNQTGKDETVVNADLLKNGAGTTNYYTTINEVAGDADATAFAVNARLGESSQR